MKGHPSGRLENSAVPAPSFERPLYEVATRIVGQLPSEGQSAIDKKNLDKGL